MVFIDGTERNEFDQYVVDIDSVTAGVAGKYSGTGKHTVKTSKNSAAMVQEALQFEIEATLGGASMVVRFQDSESLLVGMLNVATGMLEGKVYQGIKLMDPIPATDSGSFSIKKGAPPPPPPLSAAAMHIPAVVPTPAAAVAAAAPAAPPPPAGPSLIDIGSEIKKLASLKTAGLLDEVEFKAAKAKLLGLL
jgi:hypothetical protein